MHEHKMPFSWQKRHDLSTVSAGPTQYQAQAPQMLALGPVRASICDADADADEMDRIFRNCPKSQHGAAAQAMASGKQNSFEWTA